jgi:simple sugar transport system permease protein
MKRTHRTATALSAATLTALLIMLIAAPHPGKAILNFFTGPFSSRYYFGNMLSLAALLMIAGGGMSIAFRSGVFNLGGEGQVYVGAFTAAMLGTILPPESGFLGIVIMVLAASVAGATAAGLCGLFKRLWNTDELISSFLLGQSLVYTIDYLIIGPLRDQKSFLLSTPEIPKSFWLPRLLPPSHLTPVIFIAPLIVWFLYLYLFKSYRGYELRLCGLNREFARYGGINVDRHLVVPMIMSGALYGIVGAFTIVGDLHMAIQGASSGLGWNGIAVALIGANHPLLIIPAGIVFAFLQEATDTATLSSSISMELSSIVQGVVFLFITARIVIGRRKKR